jgi:hypothetical protein
VARAAPATTLFVHCCPDGVVGQPITANIQPQDNTGHDDGTFTGTVTFSTDFTDSFSLTPHDPGAGNRHKYTFKPGDLVDGGTAGKNFTLVFHEPGTGQLFATSPGLETIYDHPNTPSGSTRENDFTISPRQTGTTTTTTIVGGTTTTTLATTTTTSSAPGTTTTTLGGGGGSTTTTTLGGGGGSTTTTGFATTTTGAPAATTTTTTTPIRVAPTVRPTIAVGGAPIERDTRAGTALVLFGAFLVILASERRWRAPRRAAADEASYSEGVYRAIRNLFDRFG